MHKQKQVHSKLYGFEKVFSFTILQTVKSKSFIVSTLIMAAIFLFAIPLTNMMGEGGEMEMDGINQTKIEKVYIATDEAYIRDAIKKDEAKEFKENVEGIYDEVEFAVCDWVIARGK